MLKNYLKIAYRNLLKHKVFSFVNLAGLSLGFITALLIALYIIDELSFDTFHTKASRIYRIVETIQTDNGERQVVGAGTQIAPAALENLPEVENAVRLTVFGRLTLGYEDFRNYEDVWVTDATFFEIFDFPFISGNPKTALTEPYSVVLTQSTARKYFGDESPLGKSMYASWFKSGVKVTGVIEDFPANSHLNPPLLFSASSVFSGIPEFKKWAENDWSNNTFSTYLLLRPNANPDTLAHQLTHLAHEHLPAENQKISYQLQSLTDIHFHSENLEEDTNAHKGEIAYLYIFMSVGFLILLIAFINYVNLSTARAMKRAKEVGLRKTIGASQRQLMYQFMGESLLMVLLSVIVAITFVQLLLPFFNELSGKDLQLNLLGSKTLLFLLLVSLLSGLLAGAYPAFYLSRFKPAFIIKQSSVAQGKNLLRQGLVIAQFAIAIVLMTATMVIYQQMRFIRQSELGYDREQLLVVDINSQPMWKKYEAVKAAFQKIPAIEKVTASSRVPGDWKGLPTVSVSNENAAIDFFYLAGDHDFLPTYDIQLLEGRNFLNSPADSAKVLLNETAIKALGWTDPVGYLIEVTHAGKEKLEKPFLAEVIGVIRDVHVQSVRKKIVPTMISYYQNPLETVDYYTLKIVPQNLEKTLEAVEAVTQQFDPGTPLEYNFLDAKFEELYMADTKRGQVFALAALLAIFIACMGLFGLTNLSVEQRTREVGIRKVLGADVMHITWLISRKFIQLVSLAFLIASPFAWWAAQNWLSEFVYHIDMSVSMLLLSGMIVLCIALFTVSFQTIKAALANPVESLRYE